MGYGRRYLMFAALVLSGAPAQAECLSLTNGPIVYDVIGCKVLVPETTFDLSKEKYGWIKDLDAAGKKAFYNTYRGTYPKVRSSSRAPRPRASPTSRAR